MPAPTISLPTSGTDPKLTTKQLLENEVNTALGIVFDQANPEDRDAAEISAAAAATSEIAAEAAAVAAAISEANALNAALASGPVLPYATKALANAALSGLAANTVVEVSVDESLGNRRTRYRKTGGVYVFELDLTGKRDFYVSSDGSDSNNGLSATAPKATLAAAVAALASGDTIFLKRGSVWRETFDLTGLNSVQVIPFGGGRRPIISAWGLLSSFTLASGSRYTVTATMPAGTANRSYPGVFEDGDLLYEYRVGYDGIADSAAAIAAVAARLGSFYFAGAGTHVAGWSAGAKTFHVNASDGTNPNSNGKVYEFRERNYALKLGATNSIAGVELHSGIWHDGTDTTCGPMNDVLIVHPARHGNLPDVPTMSDVTVIAGYVAQDGGALFHSNPASLQGDVVYTRCRAIGDDRSALRVGVGFFDHGPDAVTIIRHNVTLIDCEAHNLSEGFNFSEMDGLAYLERPVVTNVNVPVRVYDGQQMLVLDGMVQAVAASTTTATFLVPVGAELTLDGGVYEVIGQFGIYAGELLGSITLKNLQFILRCEKIAGAIPTFYLSNSGTRPAKLQIQDSIIAAPDGVLPVLQDTWGLVPSILTYDNVLIINAKSEAGALQQDPVVNQSFAATTLLTVSPTARFFVIDGAKVISEDNGRNGLALKYGAWTPTDEVFRGAAYSGGSTSPLVMVLVGDCVWTSTDSAGWDKVFTPSQQLNAATFVPGSGADRRYIAVGKSAAACASDANGASWANLTIGGSSDFHAIAAGASGTVVAVGAGGVLYRSTNYGATWSVGTSSTTRTMRGIAVNGSTWIAAGDEGRVIRSTDDGATWVESTVGSVAHYAVFRSAVGSLFLLGSEAGGIRSSTDGASWTSRTSNTLNRVVAFADQPGEIVAALRQTSAHTDTFLVGSTDAVTWVPRPETLPFEVSAMIGPGVNGITAQQGYIAVGDAQSIGLRRAGVWRPERLGRTTPPSAAVKIGNAINLVG